MNLKDKRYTQWFDPDNTNKGRFPVKSTSTQATERREGTPIARSVLGEAPRGRVSSPVRPNFASGSHIGTVPNTIQARRADPWKEYLRLLYVRQGCTATLACERSTKSVDSRAFAIVETPIGEKKSHLSKLSSMRSPSFLDILEVYEWNDHLFTVAEYIPTSLHEIILSQRQPDEAQVACLAHQV